MNPAYSVIFLTTLIGAGQGLFMALYAAELNGSAVFADPATLFGYGSALAVVLLTAGMISSIFHLGRPERAWRSVAAWRTSWLAREVILLPVFIAVVAWYGYAHYAGAGGTVAIGAVGTVLSLALFYCTAMNYVCIRFIQEWATPLTIANYTLLGCASGFTLAAAFSAFTAARLTSDYATWAVLCTGMAFCTRLASLRRNRLLRPASSLQTAIGIQSPRIVQISQGAMGGSFNTREFFHGRARATVFAVKWTFLFLTFPAPLLLLAAGLALRSPSLLAGAFIVQFAGLVAERWYFFVDARHPQNLYYQAIA